MYCSILPLVKISIECVILCFATQNSHLFGNLFFYPKQIRLLNLATFQVWGQEEDGVNYEFATEVFKTKHKKRSFEKYSDNVEIVDKSTLKYGEKILMVFAEDTALRLIFKKGVFNPDAIFGKQTTKPPRKGMDTGQKVIYNMVRNDSLFIASVEELKKLNPNRKTKRFKFWLFRLGSANPQECYFELFNNKATKNTTWEEFLENAQMTFYYAGTIII